MSYSKSMETGDHHPQHFGMFSIEGNDAVHHAILDTLPHSENMRTLVYVEAIQDRVTSEGYSEAYDTAVREKIWRFLEEWFYSDTGLHYEEATIMIGEQRERHAREALVKAERDIARLDSERDRLRAVVNRGLQIAKEVS